MIILKIAFRNLLEHKAKSVIVGTLIALAVTLMVAGNSVLYSISDGLEQSYSRNFTGDLVIHGVSDESFSLIAMGGPESDIPVIPSFSELRAAAEEMPQTQAVLPLVSGSATISIGEESAGFSQLWGTDFDDYQKMFPDSLVVTEGRFPVTEGAFILLSDTVRSDAEKETGRLLSVGDKVTLGGIGSGGTRLREAEIAGFFHFRRGSAQLERISLLDANTLRSLKGMTSITMDTSSETALGASALSNTEISEDDLFGDTGSLVDGTVSGPDTSPINLESILGDTSVRSRYSAVDNNAWNFLLVKLSDSSQISTARKTLEKRITSIGAATVVSDWEWGAGMVASIALGLQLVFNGIIMIILIVAVIIIMNTLVISITERIPEIGTIRAIGGSRQFVRKMITWETLTLSIISGLVGVVLGSAIIATLHYAGIESSNMFFEVLFGGTTLRPVLSAPSIAWSLISTVCIGVLSSLYPTAVALKISPDRAMKKN